MPAMGLEALLGQRRGIAAITLPSVYRLGGDPELDRKLLLGHLELMSKEDNGLHQGMTIPVVLTLVKSYL